MLNRTPGGSRANTRIFRLGLSAGTLYGTRSMHFSEMVSRERLGRCLRSHSRCFLTLKIDLEQ